MVTLKFKPWLLSEANVVPKIYDPDALDRMARVEGERWKADQMAKPKNSFGFFAYLRAWEAIVREGGVGDISPAEAIDYGMVDGVTRGDGTIYGDGGYARYKVDRTGTILYDYNMVSPKRQALARAEGFPPY